MGKALSSKVKVAICGVAIFVILAVSIPVGIFVVAPKLGQHAVDVIELHIHNSSFYNIEGEGIPANGTMDLNMTMTSPFFIGAIMHDTVITMSAYNPVGGDAENGWTNGEMANFTMPKTTVTQGDNGVVFTSRNVSFNISEAADDQHRSFYYLIDAVSGMFVQGLVLTAEPTITALGFINIKTKFRKELVCNCVNASTWCNPIKAEYPANNSTPMLGSTNLSKPTVGDVLAVTFSVFCEPVGTNVSDATAWVDGFYTPSIPTWSDIVNIFSV